MTEAQMQVVVVGGGVAGAEALLALHELAGERVGLTLVSASDELVLPALSVAEPFALGHAARLPLADLVGHVGAELVAGTLERVDDDRREISLGAGASLAYDALLIAVGARPRERVQHATTWWPRGDHEAFQGLLRDLEEGYTKRVAFVIPAGAVWPLPLYELALMTAREVEGMGIADAELTVVTPEAVPLSLFGADASATLQDELGAAHIAIERASLARVEPVAGGLGVVLQPSGRHLTVDRVVALPGVQGPAIPGTAQNEEGFIKVGPTGQMAGSDAVWAAGDAIAYPVKYGGISTRQADAAAFDIASRAGADVPPPPRLALRGMLMTGATPRVLGGGSARREPVASGPLWRPTGKVLGTYLTPFLQTLGHEPVDEDAGHGESGGLAVDQPLPAPDPQRTDFHALWDDTHHGDYLRRLGHEMHDYERRRQ